MPRQLTERQKELLKEFEAEEGKKRQQQSGGPGDSAGGGSGGSGGGSGGKVSSTIEKAWERLRKFMGSQEQQQQSGNKDKTK